MKNQNVVEYVFYMMMSSYFKKSTCKTPNREMKMYTQYRFLPSVQQIELEKELLTYIEKQLLSQMQIRPEDQEVDVYLKPMSESAGRVLFVGKGFHYSFEIEQIHSKGKKIKFHVSMKQYYIPEIMAV